MFCCDQEKINTYISLRHIYIDKTKTRFQFLQLVITNIYSYIDEETTPLKKSYKKYKSTIREDDNEVLGYYDHEQQYEEYEDSFSMSKTTKYTLFTIIGLITLVALYFFTVFLPDYFIPEAVALKPIENISDIPVTLVPSSNKGKQRGQ